MHLLDQTAALIEWMTFKQTNIKTKRVNCTVKIDPSTWSFYRKEAHQMHYLLSFYCCWWFSLLYLIISIRFILHFYARNNDKFFDSLYHFIVGRTFLLHPRFAYLSHWSKIMLCVKTLLLLFASQPPTTNKVTIFNVKYENMYMHAVHAVYSFIIIMVLLVAVGHMQAI